MTRTPSTPARRRNRAAWGTAQKLPSGRYRAFFRLDGERIAAPETFTTKEAAQTWLAMQQADLARGVWIDPRPSGQTLTDYAYDWLDSRSDLAPRTVELYQYQLRTWLLPPLRSGSRTTNLGELPLSAITPQHIRTWHAVATAVAADRAADRKQRARTTHPARRWAQAMGMTVKASGRLSPDVLQAWQAAGSPDLTAPQPEPTTAKPGADAVASAYRLLRAICNAALRDDAIRANPCRIPGAGSNRSPERRPATIAELAAITEAMPEHLRAAVTLAAWSGLRFGELFALARRHVDTEAGTLRVERQLLKVARQPVRFTDTKTAKSRRTVHLPAFVMAALTEHMAVHTDDGPGALLFTHLGQIVDRSLLARHFKAAAKRIGREDLTWHDLRHTGATLAYRAGASVPEVQARLGHTTMRAAMIYAHAAEDADRLTASKLDALYGTASAAYVGTR